MPLPLIGAAAAGASSAPVVIEQAKQSTFLRILFWGMIISIVLLLIWLFFFDGFDKISDFLVDNIIDPIKEGGNTVINGVAGVVGFTPFGWALFPDARNKDVSGMDRFRLRWN